MKKEKILPTDIELTWRGFSCNKITNLTDEKLSELEKKLNDTIDICSYSNIEEYKYLTVEWHSKCTTTSKEVKSICKILNSL